MMYVKVVKILLYNNKFKSIIVIMNFSNSVVSGKENI